LFSRTPRTPCSDDAALQSARAILAKEQRELARQTLIVQALFREAESLLRKQ
jgi:hypothetical protein